MTSKRRSTRYTSRMAWDKYGRLVPEVDTSGMMSPAQCTHCSGVYDLGAVTITARYADCSMWKAPCCGVTVDDRGETGWKSRADYRRLS